MFEIILKSLNCSAGKNKQGSPLIAHQPLALNHLSDNSRKVRKNIRHSPGWHLNLRNPRETEPTDASDLPPCSAINSPLAWSPQWKWSPFSLQPFYNAPSLFMFSSQLNQLLFQRMGALCLVRVGYNYKPVYLFGIKWSETEQ